MHQKLNVVYYLSWHLRCKYRHWSIENQSFSEIPNLAYNNSYPNPCIISLLFINMSRDNRFISSNVSTLANLFQNEPVVPYSDTRILFSAAIRCSHQSHSRVLIGNEFCIFLNIIRLLRTLSNTVGSRPLALMHCS